MSQPEPQAGPDVWSGARLAHGQLHGQMRGQAGRSDSTPRLPGQARFDSAASQSGQGQS